MRKALAIAERGRGSTHPNPVVGALVVKGDRVLGSGHHKVAGGPHAEVAALDRVGKGARGATLYVTLEPCCHVGRTGPCTKTILEAGIRRVVVGCLDENPLVWGRGIAAMRRAGVKVDVGCLKTECRAANRGFFTWIRSGRPLVTLKAAASLDGFIAPPKAGRSNGRIHWITGPRARQAAHELRRQHDAVLVGAGTVAADDPRLTVRLPGAAAGPAPLRVVLDGRLSSPPTARLFRQKGVAPPLVLGADPEGLAPTLGRTVAAKSRALGRAGAELLWVPSDREGRIPLLKALEALGQRGVQSVLVEGGSLVFGALINARLVDRVAFFLAPTLMGGGIPISAGPGLPPALPLRFGPLEAQPLSGDILLRADVVAEP